MSKDERSYAIIGAAMEVHRILGPGFLEAVYQQALAVELDLRALPYQREVSIAITYKSNTLSTFFRPDFVCFDGIIVEVKALARLSTADEAQIINYLKASGKKIGLLLNFGTIRLDYKRFILSAAQPNTSV